MSYLYVWKTKRLAPDQARRQFDRILAGQSDLYQRACGYSFAWKSHQAGSILIGQVQVLDNIPDWAQWAQNGEAGVAWSGVCEDYLGASFDAQLIRRIVTTTHATPERLADLDGRFAMCTWDGDDVRLTTAVAECPSLWLTEGPHGWATGSRSAPLLEMVGRRPALNHDAASLYIGFGYQIGGEGLFEGVTRLTSRQQLAFGVGESAPTARTYLPLRPYVEGGDKPASWQDAVDRCAMRLVTRVKNQLQHSPAPHLLLTSGRDSRGIAAAAAVNGFNGTAHTTGGIGTTEVRVASNVARALNIQHEAIPVDGAGSPMQAVSLELATLWCEMGEGMDVLRQAIQFQGFFRRDLPFPPVRQQLLHGLGGEITRGFYYANAAGNNLNAPARVDQACGAIAKKVPLGLALRRPLEPLLLQAAQPTAAQLDDRRITLAQWLDAFYWQDRCLKWGSDMLSAREILYWHWTPLMDRVFIQTGWSLKPSDKVTDRFVEAVTWANAPALREVAYDQPASATKMLLKQLAKRALGIANHYNKRLFAGITFRPPHVQGDEHLLRFWDDVFFRNGEHAWPELIDEPVLRLFLSRNPTAEVLWNIATVELVAQAHCA